MYRIILCCKTFAALIKQRRLLVFALLLLAGTHNNGALQFPQKPNYFTADRNFALLAKRNLFGCVNTIHNQLTLFILVSFFKILKVVNPQLYKHLNPCIKIRRVIEFTHTAVVRPANSRSVSHLHRRN